MIIDQTYFIREINIPQISQPAVGENVDLFIAKYQPRFLKAVFGLALAKLIEDYLEAETQDEPVLDERIGLILDGAEITSGGVIEQVWEGLRNTGKNSPLANFIFYHIMTDEITFLSQSGEAMGTSENSQKASPDGRLVSVWNDMVEMMVSLRQLMETGDYPEYKPEQVFTVINRFNL